MVMIKKGKTIKELAPKFQIYYCSQSNHFIRRKKNVKKNNYKEGEIYE